MYLFLTFFLPPLTQAPCPTQHTERSASTSSLWAHWRWWRSAAVPVVSSSCPTFIESGKSSRLSHRKRASTTRGSLSTWLETWTVPCPSCRLPPRSHTLLPRPLSRDATRRSNWHSHHPQHLHNPLQHWNQPTAPKWTFRTGKGRSWTVFAIQRAKNWKLDLWTFGSLRSCVLCTFLVTGTCL